MTSVKEMKHERFDAAVVWRHKAVAALGAYSPPLQSGCREVTRRFATAYGIRDAIHSKLVELRLLGRRRVAYIGGIRETLGATYDSQQEVGNS